MTKSLAFAGALITLGLAMIFALPAYIFLALVNTSGKLARIARNEITE